MKTFLDFAGKVLVVVLAIIIIAGCGLITVIAYQWVAEAPVAEAPVAEAPVAEAPVVEAPVAEAPVVEAPVVEAPVVERTANMETECDYVDGYTSKGLTVRAGTKVFGPAFVKPDRDISWGYPIYVGEEYVTRASDEVIWLLAGDNACVDAQAQYFTYWDKENPSN